MKLQLDPLTVIVLTPFCPLESDVSFSFKVEIVPPETDVTTATCELSPFSPWPLDPPHIEMMSPAVGIAELPLEPVEIPYSEAAVATKLPPTRPSPKTVSPLTLYR